MRKMTFTLCLFVWAFTNTSAQSIGVTPNDSASVTANAPDEFEPIDVHIHVINNYGQATSFMWMMKDYTAPQQWELKLCDNNNCYDLLIGAPLHESLEVAAGDSMDMKFQYSPHCVSGTGNTNVIIYVTGDSAATAVTLNYKADLTATCATAVIELAPNALRLFPNPVKNTFTVTGLENTGNLSFEVYDLKGAVVPSKFVNATSSTIEISIDGLPAGTYVLKAIDGNGKVIGSSRLNKID